MSDGCRRLLAILCAALLLLSFAVPAAAQEDEGEFESASPSAGAPTTGSQATASGVPWWVWPLALFFFCLVLGVVAVMAGVGGGVLFVPLVAGFFPFHIDFVRSTGLLIGLAGALAAGPGLLRRGLTGLRVVLPCALMASCGSLLGAKVGLSMSAAHVQMALGVCMLGVLAMMFIARSKDFPDVPRPGRLSGWFGLGGAYHEESLGVNVAWKVHRVPAALATFVGVGFLGGLFGLGAGWANVPVFNLMMGLPLKMAVGSSVLLISVSNSSAAWEYLKQGAWLPIMALPSILGLMLGTGFGVKLLGRAHPRSVRWIVVAALAFAAVRSILKGMGVWT